MRAPDKWDSARFLALFLASSFSRLPSRVSARPLAGNASRWAASRIPLVLFESRVELLQLARTHSAATCKMKSTSSYLGGAECAS